MKTMFFVSGLPRSGSTLLCNILNQNPHVYASPTSGVIEIVLMIRNRWDKILEWMSQPEDLSTLQKINVMKSTLQGSYAHRPEKYIFDKSRGWLAHIEMLEELVDEVKILVPVRDIPEILASFEMLWRKSSAVRQVPVERDNYLKMQTVKGRCEVWASDTQPLGLAYNRIKDALHRGHKDKMFFVKYDDMISDPVATMEKVYSFLGMENFEHDFDNIKQVTKESDRFHGWGDLHTIRSRIENKKRDWKTVLGDVGIRYFGQELW